MSDRIAFSTIDNDFTVSAERSIQSAEHSYISTGRIDWNSLKINGVEYPGGSAWVIYRDDRGFSLYLNLYVGLYGRREFSDSARTKLTEALLNAPEVQHLYTVPTLDEVNDYILTRARNEGLYEADSQREVNRVTGEVARAACAVTRKTVFYPHSLPKAPGLVTDDDLKRAYYEGLIAGAQAQLDRLSK